MERRADGGGVLVAQQVARGAGAARKGDHAVDVEAADVRIGPLARGDGFVDHQRLDLGKRLGHRGERACYAAVRAVDFGQEGQQVGQVVERFAQVAQQLSQFVERQRIDPGKHAAQRLVQPPHGRRALSQPRKGLRPIAGFRQGGHLGRCSVLRAVGEFLPECEQAGKVRSAKPCLHLAARLVDGRSGRVLRRQQFEHGGDLRLHRVGSEIVARLHGLLQLAPRAAEEGEERAFLGSRQFETGGGVRRRKRVLPAASLLGSGLLARFQRGDPRHVALQGLRGRRERVEQAGRGRKAGRHHALGQGQRCARFANRGRAGDRELRVLDQRVEPLELALGSPDSRLQHRVGPLVPHQRGREACEGVAREVGYADDLGQRAEYALRHWSRGVPVTEAGQRLAFGRADALRRRGQSGGPADEIA